jgi:hypothetical protein
MATDAEITVAGVRALINELQRMCCIKVWRHVHPDNRVEIRYQITGLPYLVSAKKWPTLDSSRITAEHFGDPLPGRSALDRKKMVESVVGRLPIE